MSEGIKKDLKTMLQHLEKSYTTEYNTHKKLVPIVEKLNELVLKLEEVVSIAHEKAKNHQLSPPPSTTNHNKKDDTQMSIQFDNTNLKRERLEANDISMSFTPPSSKRTRYVDMTSSPTPQTFSSPLTNQHQQQQQLPNDSLHDEVSQALEAKLQEIYDGLNCADPISNQACVELWNVWREYNESILSLENSGSIIEALLQALDNLQERNEFRPSFQFNAEHFKMLRDTIQSTLSYTHN